MGNITTDFIAATKKIHADVRAILITLRLIREDVKAISDQAVGEADSQASDQQKDHPEKEQSNRASIGSQVLNVNQSNGEQENPSKTTGSYLGDIYESFKRSFRTAKFFLELAALVVVIVYTCETKRTNDLTEASLQTSKYRFDESERTSKIRFESDQRPYVWPAKFMDFPVKIHQQIMTSVYYVNYGRTPAIKMRSGGTILVFNQTEGTLVQADRFFAMFDESRMTGGSEIIIPPGIPPDLLKSSFFDTDRSSNVPPPANQADVDEINGKDGSFAVVGVVVYDDSAGNHYRSDYCMMHLKNKLWAACTRHNEIH